MKGVTGFVALAVAASGCGGSERLSKSEYVARADAICVEYEKKFAPIPEPKTLAEVPAAIDKGLPLARRELAALRRLKPPEEDEATVDRMLDEVEKTIQGLERLGTAAEQGDRAAAQTAAGKLQAASEKADRLAREYGLEQCGSQD